MKRRSAVALCVVVGALLVASVAGVALAKNINCSKIVCYGTNKADLITGSNRTQTIIARGGNDTVFALGGNDTVRGQGGDDRASGGAGDDSVYGQAGNDTLSDTLGPNTGDPADRDLIFGGTGDDTVDVVDGDSLDIVCRVPASGGTDNGSARGDAGDDLSGLNCPWPGRPPELLVGPLADLSYVPQSKKVAFWHIRTR